MHTWQTICIVSSHMANIIVKKHLIATKKKATSANFKIKKSTLENKKFKTMNLNFFKKRTQIFLNVLSNQTLQFRKTQNPADTTITTATSIATFLYLHLLSKYYQIQI